MIDGAEYGDEFARIEKRKRVITRKCLLCTTCMQTTMFLDDTVCQSCGQKTLIKDEFEFYVT